MIYSLAKCVWVLFQICEAAKYIFTETDSVKNMVETIMMEPGLVKDLYDHTVKPTDVVEKIYDHHSLDPQFPDMTNPHVAVMHEILVKIISLVQVSNTAVGRINNFSKGMKNKIKLYWDIDLVRKIEII